MKLGGEPATTVAIPKSVKKELQKLADFWNISQWGLVSALVKHATANPDDFDVKVYQKHYKTGADKNKARWEQMANRVIAVLEKSGPHTPRELAALLPEGGTPAAKIYKVTPKIAVMILERKVKEKVVVEHSNGSFSLLP